MSAESESSLWAITLRVLERYGFAVVACCGIAWFANAAIEYEREKMMPALENNTKAIERNTEVFRQLPDILRKGIEETEKKK